jgi:hypothetical protein
MIFGDGTSKAFSSYAGAPAYTDTAKGLVKVDWFTMLRTTTLIPGPQLPAYAVGKVAWSAGRYVSNRFSGPMAQLPITNFWPFRDPVETNTALLAAEEAGFRTLFPPEYMKENCGQ